MATAIKSSPGCTCLWVSDTSAFELSRQLNTGEFECFCMAAARWGVPLCRVKEDFARYLRAGDLPLYMEDWMHQVSIEQAVYAEPAEA